MDFKKALGVSLIGFTLSGLALADVHPAKITSIKKIGEDASSRTFEVTYHRKATEQVLGASVTFVPSPHITEHTRHMVAVVLSGEPSASESSVAGKLEVKVERGDVIDTSPVPLQPPVTYSCRIFSGIPRPPEHCKSGTTKEACNAIGGCRWLASDYAGPWPPAPRR